MANGWLTVAWRQQQAPAALEGVRAVRIPDGTNWTTPGCAERVREELSRLLASCPFRVSDALSGEAGVQLWLQLDENTNETLQYRIPKTRPRDRDTVALLTACKEAPFDEASCLFDYRVDGDVLERGVVRVPVTALVAPQKAVTALQTATAPLGCTPTGITSALLSMRNLYASDWLACPWERFAFVEVSAAFIRILLFSQGRLLLIRTPRPGWYSLVNALQKTKRPPATLQNPDGVVSADALEQLFLCHSAEEEAELRARLDQPLQKLKQKLEETLSYATERDQPAMQGIVLSAPRACAALLQATFEEILPCQRLQFCGAATEQGRKDLEHASATVPEAHLLRAIGLCLSDNARTPNALMTSATRRQQVQHTHIARLALASALVLTLLIGLASVQTYRTLLHLHQEQRALQTHLAGFTQLFKPDDVRTTLALAKQRYAVLRTVEKRRLVVALISELAATTSDTILLSGLRVTFPSVLGALSEDTSLQYTPAVSPSTPSANTVAPSAVVVISGSVSGDLLQRESQLAEYLNRLGQSPLTLSLHIEKQQDSTETLSFVATLTLIQA
ncbi:MAG: hypothetical protein RR317_00265 [Bilophila sp.]